MDPTKVLGEAWHVKHLNRVCKNWSNWNYNVTFLVFIIWCIMVCVIRKMPMLYQCDWECCVKQQCKTLEYCLLDCHRCHHCPYCLVKKSHSEYFSLIFWSLVTLKSSHDCRGAETRGKLCHCHSHHHHFPCIRCGTQPPLYICALTWGIRTFEHMRMFKHTTNTSS